MLVMCCLVWETGVPGKVKEIDQCEFKIEDPSNTIYQNIRAIESAPENIYYYVNLFHTIGLLNFYFFISTTVLYKQR